MMTETEIRQLRDDVLVYITAGPGRHWLVVQGVEMALTLVLGEPDNCYDPGVCSSDHQAQRDKNLKTVRDFAKAYRAKERALRQ
jgi:hypothetical protein